MKILIGGVPFGRDNVGDEAILETVIHVVRKCRPDAEITVSTDDRDATAEKFSVRTVELFGFAPPYSKERMRHELESHEVFIWAGATGLSDYPEISTQMLRIAQQAGRRTVVWNVGMNDELNPAKYKLTSGKKKMVLECLSCASLGTWDGVEYWETHAGNRAKECIKVALDACDLVVVRDPESREELTKCRLACEVVVGADTAILLEPDTAFEPNPEVKELLAASRRVFGLCVSAQRKIQNASKLVRMLDRVVSELDVDILFIPMNPVTDAKLMAELHQKMQPENRKHAAVLTGIREPGEVLALTRHLDVVASSRLHLLILSSIYRIPLIGISRGSKVDNFLNPFGLKAVGTVESCDFDAFYQEIDRRISGQEQFMTSSHEVMNELKGRLANATRCLQEVLSAS